MNTKMIAGGALAGLILTGATLGAVSAQSINPDVSMEKAMEIALLEVPGEVQEVELEKEDGAMVYEVEILTADGEAFEIEIAADTGTILEVEAEDEDDDDEDDD